MLSVSGHCSLLLLILLFLTSPVRADAQEPTEPPRAHLNGQRVYVPVYSSIRYLNDAQYDLAVTLSIRNTDPDHELQVTSALYYDNDGQQVKNFLPQPRTLPGLGSMELFIPQADLRGHSGANFVIQWQAEAAVSAPIIEAVMIGSRGTQGIAFTSRGVVINP